LRRQRKCASPSRPSSNHSFFPALCHDPHLSLPPWQISHKSRTGSRTNLAQKLL
jgi:hypothetical protein